MKKLALSMILGASLMVTSSAFALTSMTDSSMKSATGQAGVSIAIDNVVIESFTGETAYIDEDGVSDASIGQTDTMTNAELYISNRHVVKKFLAMTSASDFATDFANEVNVNGVTGVASKGTWLRAHALTIDIGTCATLTAGMSDNLNQAAPVVGVVIGLPTLLISTSEDTYSVGVRGAAINTDKKFITIRKSGSVTAILGGTLEIAPH